MFGLGKKVDAGLAPVEKIGTKAAPFTKLSGRPKDDLVGASVMPDRVTSSMVQKGRAGAALMEEQVTLAKELAPYMKKIQDKCTELHGIHQDVQANAMKNAVKVTEIDAAHVQAVAHFNHLVGGVKEETKVVISQYDDESNRYLREIGF